MVTKSKAILLVTILILSGALSAAPVLADPPVNSDDAGVAIKGYDPVAYFTQSRAVKGSHDHTYQWRESTWYFISATHRDLFVADPERYTPQYGGF